jgi:hypothetical protein
MCRKNELDAAFFGTLFALVSVVAGCNSSGEAPQRGQLNGKVTLDGQPASAGMIRFIALDPNGINAAAKITNGEYSLPPGEGPAKGKYRVEFSVPHPTKKNKMKNPDNEAEWLEEPVEVLPARYHRNSTVVLDYDPDNPQPHNFELSSH